MRTLALATREELALLNPDALFADGIDDALIGYTMTGDLPVAVYDFEKCVNLFVKQGMDVEEAEDHVNYSVLRACDFFENSGDTAGNAPVFIRMVKTVPAGTCGIK